MCDRAANSHRPFTNLAELDRSVSDALAGGSVQAPSSGESGGRASGYSVDHAAGT